MSSSADEQGVGAGALLSGVAGSPKQPPASGGPMPVRFGGAKCPPPALSINHPSKSSREQFCDCGDKGTFRVLDKNLEKRYVVVEVTIEDRKQNAYWYLDDKVSDKAERAGRVQAYHTQDVEAGVPLAVGPLATPEAVQHPMGHDEPREQIHSAVPPATI